MRPSHTGIILLDIRLCKMSAYDYERFGMRDKRVAEPRDEETGRVSTWVSSSMPTIVRSFVSSPIEARGQNSGEKNEFGFGVFL